MAKKKWQTLLARADRAAREGKGSLFDRVSLLAQVLEDPQFKADMLREQRKPMVVLNAKVEDTFTNFAELYAMLKAFPDRARWEGGDLPAMRDALREQLRARANAERQAQRQAGGAAPPGAEGGPAQTTRTTVTLAQFRKLEEENRMLRQEVEHLREELRLAKDTIDLLKGYRGRASA